MQADRPQPHSSEPQSGRLDTREPDSDRLDSGQRRPDQSSPDQPNPDQPGSAIGGSSGPDSSDPDSSGPDTSQPHSDQSVSPVQADLPHDLARQSDPAKTARAKTDPVKTDPAKTDRPKAVRPSPGAFPTTRRSSRPTPGHGPGRRTTNISPEEPAQARLPLVTIQQLDYLVAIAESTTWAAAAKRLQVSPSALSQGIAELERRLGLQLFERVGRRRVFAASSQPVLDYARSVIAQSNDLGRWIVEQSAGGSGQLRVGMIDAAALHYFSEALRGFRSDFPDVDLRLTVLPSGPLVEALSQNELDLAVVVRPAVQPADLDFTAIASDPLGIYAPEGARGNKAKNWGPWVAFPKTSHTRAQIADALRILGAPFDVVAESNQPEVLSEMVRLGLGWAVLPILQAESGPNPLRRAITEPLLYRPLVAVRRNNALPHPNAEELLRRLSR